MKNRLHAQSGAGEVMWTNTSGAAKSPGDVVRVGSRWGVCHVAIAAAAVGAVYTLGTYDLAKGSSDVFAAGEVVGWSGTQITRDLSGGILGVIEEAAASGTTRAAVALRHENPGASSASVAASATLTNTTTPTKFDKQFTIPANTLRPGDIVRVRAQVVTPSTNSTDTLNLKLFIGALECVATGAVDVANGDIGFIDFDAVVRTVGASGTVVGAGHTALGVPGTVTSKPKFLASSTLDTTVANAVAVEGTWSVANAGNQARLDVMNVQVIRPGSALV